MQAISLFTGIGGFEIAFNQVFGSEAQVIQSVEIDPDAQQVLKSHFPSTPIHSDICTYTPCINWNYTDGLLFAGFPCTNTSCAGDRAGLQGTESSLWLEMLRIICITRPRFIVVENPTGLINRGLRAVLGGLRVAGYQWDDPQIVSAAEVGAPHERERVFVVAYPYGWSQKDRQPPTWTSQVGSQAAIARLDSQFPTVEQRDDGAVYGIPEGLDNVPLSVPTGTPGRIKSRYLYGRTVVPSCAVVAFQRIKFLEQWWRDAIC